MSVVWVICGAGRGVGKTHLARRLCEVLPRSVYAKLGHGKRAADKPANFFHAEADLAAWLEQQRDAHEHIVLESNVHARRGEGDVIIFLEAVPGRTDPRADAETLRERAHIVIAAASRADDPERALRARLPDAPLCEAVGEALREQAQWMRAAGPQVRTKVWFVAGERRVFGPGLARLLANIARDGTLSEAARAAGMSYRHAWDLVREAEQRLGRTLVERQPGGHGGGQSSLAPDGERLLRIYRQVSREVARYADRRFAAHMRKEGFHDRQ